MCYFVREKRNYIAVWKVSRFFNLVSWQRKGYEYSPRRMWQRRIGRNELRSRARKGDVGGCRRRGDGSLFLSAVNNLSPSSIPRSIYLPFFWRTSPRVRALAARKFTGWTAGVSQIFLFTILPDVRRAPRTVTIVRCIGGVYKFICAHRDLIMIIYLSNNLILKYKWGS